MKQPIYNGANEDECEYYDVVQGEIEYNKMKELNYYLVEEIGWDKDIWTHRHSIIDKLSDMGFNVSQGVNHGVLDVVITANLEL